MTGMISPYIIWIPHYKDVIMGNCFKTHESSPEALTSLSSTVSKQEKKQKLTDKCESKYNIVELTDDSPKYSEEPPPQYSSLPNVPSPEYSSLEPPRTMKTPTTTPPKITVLSPKVLIRQPNFKEPKRTSTRNVTYRKDGTIRSVTTNTREEDANYIEIGKGGENVVVNIQY